MGSSLGTMVTAATFLLACAGTPPRASTERPADGVAVASSPEVAIVELPPAPTVQPAASARPSATSIARTSAIENHPGLRDPSKAVLRAPSTFLATFTTTAGPLAFMCERAFGPHGADRIFSLINIGFFSDVRFFRVVTKPRPFVVQFGINGDPRVSAAWRDAKLPADPVVASNLAGTLTFAQAGQPDTRTTQLFINLSDNTSLDKMDFTPICKLTGDVEASRTTLSRIFAEHGDEPTRRQTEITREGNAFLDREFPDLDFIISATTDPPAR